MLSPFPELYDWYYAVPTLFRIVLGGYALVVAFRMIRNSAGLPKSEVAWRILGFLMIPFSFLMLLGYHIQYVSAIGFIVGLVAVRSAGRAPYLSESAGFYVLAAVMSLSLILLGPGLYAIGVAL
jgi:hypothetical protein